MIGFVTTIRVVGALDIARLVGEAAARDMAALTHGPSLLQLAVAGAAFFVWHEATVLVLAGRRVWRRWRGRRG
jgi:hypothetical protein